MDFPNTLSLSLPFAIRLYHPPLPARLPSYILDPYSAVVDKTQMVFLYLRVHVTGSIWERTLCWGK